MFNSTDIEKIIDDVLKHSTSQNQNYPTKKNDIDSDLYADVSVSRSPVKYTDPIDQRRQ